MITAIAQARSGTQTTVTVTSDLVGTVYYHWWLDGLYLGRTEFPQYTVHLAAEAVAEIYCVDTLDPAFDYEAAAPASYPAFRTIEWVRSLDSDVSRYLIEQKLGAGAWTEIGAVGATQAWLYRFSTPPLTDLASYQWRVVATDAAGNRGTVLEGAAETIVRKPAAPVFSIAWSPTTSFITVSG